MGVAIELIEEWCAEIIDKVGEIRVQTPSEGLKIQLFDFTGYFQMLIRLLKSLSALVALITLRSGCRVLWCVSV